MKTFVLIFSMVLASAPWSHAQPMTVTDEFVLRELQNNVSPRLETMDGNLEQVLQKVTEQLNLAQEDNVALDEINENMKKTQQHLSDLLTRIGDPSAVQMGDIADYGKVKTQVHNALQDGIVKDRPDVNPNDRSLFDSNYTEGIIEPLNNRFEVKMDTNNDGKYETENPERDVKRYIGETEQIKAVKEYYRVRDAAVIRREALLEVLKDVLEDMQNNSNDFAHLAKQTALVEVIQGQLQVCSNDINNAFNDAAVKGLQVYALNSAKTKADAEPSLYEMDKQKEKLESIADTLDDTVDPVTQGDLQLPTGAKEGEYLPWINHFVKPTTP